MSAGPFTLGHFRKWAKSLVLDSFEPWVLESFQEQFAEDLFDGVEEAWLVVPEGNGKSTLIAGLGLYFLEHRRHATIPVGASSRDQAKIIYDQAEGFVIRSEWMHEMVDDPIRQARGKRAKQVPKFECQNGMRRIRYFAGGLLQVFAADDRTGDGIIPTLCLVDELHRHRDLRLYRTWRGKLQKRGGQIVAISTAGEPGSEFELTREAIRRSGEVSRDGSFVRARSNNTVIHDWAVPEDADVEDMATVAQANPFSGVTEDMLKTKFDSPTMTLGHWRRFVCNLPTRSEMAAITEQEWFDQETKEEVSAGEPVWLGLDVAWKWDTTAAVPLWWRDGEFRLLGAARVLEPPRDGSSLDPALIEAALIEIHDRNPVHTVVMDMARAEQLASWIETELGARVIDWSQSNPQAVTDYERFMEALRQGWLFHTGDEQLTRHALNAIARVLPRGDAVFERPAQSRHGREQDRRVIDALKAASMVNSAAAELEARPSAPLVAVT